MRDTNQHLLYFTKDRFSTGMKVSCCFEKRHVFFTELMLLLILTLCITSQAHFKETYHTVLF